MASKTITISKEAYERLKSRKDEKESFTDVINKLTRERSLTEIAGILSEDEADRLEERIKETRNKTRDRIDDIKGSIEDAS
ncbi:MAG: antitoxin VapB family protein [Candidatus Thermoplasmatota archaeon]|nr:antitoxin VapB family protein [Candidatus Thermoplasmatota archaeon]